MLVKGSAEVCKASYFNSMRPRQNGSRFADDLFKCIFLNENVRSSIKISLEFIPKGPINKISALIQIMAWCRSGDKPLSEAMVFSLLTHICVTRPQWVKDFVKSWCGRLAVWNIASLSNFMGTSVTVLLRHLSNIRVIRQFQKQILWLYDVASTHYKTARETKFLEHSPENRCPL